MAITMFVKAVNLGNKSNNKWFAKCPFLGYKVNSLAEIKNYISQELEYAHSINQDEGWLKITFDNSDPDEIRNTPFEEVFNLIRSYKKYNREVYLNFNHFEVVGVQGEFTTVLFDEDDQIAYYKKLTDALLFLGLPEE